MKYTPDQLAHHLDGQRDGRPLLTDPEIPLETVLTDLLALRSYWYEQADVILDGQNGKPLDHDLYKLARDFFSAPSSHNS